MWMGRVSASSLCGASPWNCAPASIDPHLRPRHPGLAGYPTPFLSPQAATNFSATPLLQ